jgi:L,D-transpeptidase-like protein/putative peptidoglycan binding protein
MRPRTTQRARTRKRAVPMLIVLCGAAWAILPAQEAAAQTTGVTLTASATSVASGAAVMLTAQVDPAAAGEPVAFVDAGGATLASGTTDTAGAFSATIRPTSSLTVHAVWGASTSADLVIAVLTAIDVHLGPVRLFDWVVVRGSVRPSAGGVAVKVSLIHAGDVVATRRPTTGTAGNFRTRLPILDPGSYRVRARPSGGGSGASDVDGPRSTPLPTLRTGSHGIFVRLLERRLAALHYRLVGIDRLFDYRTADAVMAFRKVQRMQRTNDVDATVWRALADPVVPHPRVKTNGFHIEVDQTRQVLYTVDDGAITNILHVSTGKPSTPTLDGSFFVNRKIAGYSEHLLYYPSYFDGNRAIHGWPDVPSYAASHGCVRVPYWNAKWIFGLDPIGTRVLVYHE